MAGHDRYDAYYWILTQSSDGSATNSAVIAVGNAVPEPDSVVMLALGLAGLGAAARRRIV